MSTTVVVGAQWGDEGKGRIVDALAAESDMVIRFFGGDNAGHTIVVGDQVYKLHLCPGGIVREGMTNIVGPGVVFNLEVGCRELDIADRHKSVVHLDYSTPVILPIHRAIDAGREAVASRDAIGTTKRGIGPVYSDFWLRRGITLGDLSNANHIRSVLLQGGYWNELVALCKHLGVNEQMVQDLNLNFDPMNLDATIKYCMRHSDQICKHVADTRRIVHDAVNRGLRLLFEGANSIGLDRILSSSRHSTSSICSAAGSSASFGIYHFDRIIGVTKAYDTRVGNGPFLSEQLNSIGDLLRERGHEYGTTTGRPRRCGWLDLRFLHNNVVLGGITELVVTKLDILSDLPELKVIMHYDNVDRDATLTGAVQNSARPLFEDAEPWIQSISDARCLADLPSAAIEYLRNIAGRTGVPISGVSVGAERDAMFWEEIPAN